MTKPFAHNTLQAASRRPRIGCLGLGWIGRHRLDHVIKTERVDVICAVEPSDDAFADALALAPSLIRTETLDDMLSMGIDGLMIATPSALHAAQTIEALRHGVAVFCQKPLGRNAQEVSAAAEAARQANRLLAVDMSYRFVDGIRQMRNLVEAHALGRIHSVDLTFHNAYGPDKDWFYDPERSGGGCLMDLGVHLVDLACWLTGKTQLDVVCSDLFSKGVRIAGRDVAEDTAFATLRSPMGMAIRVACSWKLHAGQDAVIAVDIHGSEGGAALSNVDGSFYDFVTHRFQGTKRSELSSFPEAWGGRAAAQWATQLAANPGFDPAIRALIPVAEIVDEIYAKANREAVFRGQSSVPSP